jgi:16S rRNA (uracil1498-N3)-methyltransferase
VGNLAAPVLRADDARHLGRVRRLRDGEVVIAADGIGSWRPCTWSDGALAVAGPVVPPSGEPRGPGGGRVAVGFVPTKGDRPEWVVQKLTELGVDRIVVVSSARSVVRWDGERGDRHLDKLTEVARQAGMQSRRPALPVVEGVVALDDLVASPGSGWSMAVPGGPSPGPVGPAGAAVVIGPEGGWTPAEEACGLPAVGLGPGVMRAETAAMAAGALLGALRAGLVAAVGA